VKEKVSCQGSSQPTDFAPLAPALARFGRVGREATNQKVGSSNLPGAPFLLAFNYFRKPCNHLSLCAAVEIRESCVQKLFRYLTMRMARLIVSGLPVRAKPTIISASVNSLSTPRRDARFYMASDLCMRSLRTSALTMVRLARIRL
jgi:hypothetical protein